MVPTTPDHPDGTVSPPQPEMIHSPISQTDQRPHIPSSHLVPERSSIYINATGQKPSSTRCSILRAFVKPYKSARLRARAYAAGGFPRSPWKGCPVRAMATNSRASLRVNFMTDCMGVRRFTVTFRSCHVANTGLVPIKCRTVKNKCLRNKAFPRFASLMWALYFPEVDSAKFNPALRKSWPPCVNRRRSPVAGCRHTASDGHRMTYGYYGTSRSIPMGRGPSRLRCLDARCNGVPPCYGAGELRRQCDPQIPSSRPSVSASTN